jgi:FKBP-type peptidyl-prolyl cis-trans isomerase
MNRKNFRAIVALIAVVLMISVASCNPSSKMDKLERNEINTYLTQNSNLNFVKQTSGLYYLEVMPGTGTSPVLADSAYVKYTGKLLDGTVFSTNVSGTLYGFVVGYNIDGFDEGIMLMKPGGKATLLIPSSLAYGASGNYYAGISGYTPLLFDIELVKVVPHTGK